MPVYNGERFIKQAIESILCQTLRDFELVIVNDASFDGTIQIVNSFTDKRIRLINSSKRLGLAKIRDKGIRECRGEFIAFLDSDDIALPQRLEKQWDYMDRNREISLTGSWVKVIDDEDKLTGRVFKHVCRPEIIKSVLLFRNCFTQSAVMIRKAAVQKHGFRSSFNAAPDFDLWSRLAQHLRLANIPRVFSLYREYKGNLTDKTSPEIENCTRRIFAASLEKMGLAPTEEEILVHDSLERKKDGWTLKALVKAKYWLQKLCQANGENKVYDRKIFEQLLFDYWFKICCLGADWGIPVFQLYKDLSFRKQVRIKERDLILFMLTSIKKSKHIDITANTWINSTYPDL